MKPHRILLIACFLLGVLHAKAITNAGGNITYKAIDSVNYEVTVKLYVDCNGITSINDTLTVSWLGGSFMQKMSFIKSEDITGSFNGCGISSRCSGSFQYGFQEREYKTTVNLSNTACLVIFDINGGTRSSAITTGAANTKSYLYATLNKCYGPNNSAHTSFPPRILIPVGSDIVMGTGYVDNIDEDSLVFELVNPQSASGVNVTYSGIWSSSRPITFLGFPSQFLSSPAGFHFDKQTGSVSFRPTIINQQTVFVVRVHEYRNINGNIVEVGVTEIEQMVVVIASASNKPPVLSPPYSLDVCAGETIELPIISDDRDSNDSTFLEWSSTISGATFTIDTTKRLKTAIFRWTPTQADIRNLPYTFSVRVRDNGCSPNGTNDYTFSLTVKGKTNNKYLQIVSKQNSCNRFNIVMGVPAGANLTRGYIVPEGYIRSSTRDEAEIYFNKAGWNKYAVWAKEGFLCADTAWDSTYVTIPYTLKISHIPDSAVCPNQAINLVAQTVNGSPPYIYRWATGIFINPSAVYNYVATTNYAFFDLKVIDSLGCYYHDSVKITTLAPQAATFLTPQTVCKNASPFVLKAIPSGGKWTGFGVVNDSIFEADRLSQSGQTIVNYYFTDSNKCPSHSYAPIQVASAPVLQFSAAPTQGIAPLTVDFFGLSFPEGNNWMWYFTNTTTNKTDSISGQLPTYTFVDSGEYIVTLKADTAGCVETLTKNNFIRAIDTTQSGGGGGGGGNVGVGEVNNNGLKIYPNPAKDALTIELADDIEEIEVYDIHGKMTLHRSIEAIKSTQISVSNLADGIYFVRIKAINKGYILAKILVQQ